ncbi:MAG: Gp15 family bacteriophage protein [Faecalibacterium sp.]
MTDLLEPLPTTWAGRPIDPDFRVMAQLANAYARKEPDKDPIGFAAGMCRRFYRVPVPEQKLPSAYRDMLDFYLAAEPQRSGTDDGSGTAGGELSFDYRWDAPYLIAAFQETYDIDLTSAPLHWWRFRALLTGLLGGECLFARIVRWRTADLARLSEAEREHTQQMRQRFALPPELRGGAARAVSVADHDAAFLARLRHR